MIEFPETAAQEWKALDDITHADERVRKRIRESADAEIELSKQRKTYVAREMLQAEINADLTPVLKMGTLSALMAQPTSAPVDMIEGVCKSGLCLLLGPSSSGKSTLALQMLHSLLTGAPFLGQTVTPITGSVGILSYDMDAGLMGNWMSGFPNLDPLKVSIVDAYKGGSPIAVPEMRKRIANAWKAMGVEVVLMDSFSASFFGKDQNDAASTMLHYRDMKKFALDEVGAKLLIVIVHSAPNSPDKARGSTVHHDVADSIVGLDVKDNGSRTVKMIKYRAGLGQQQMHSVAIGCPDVVTHLVDLDFGAMSLMNMSLPPGNASAHFMDVDDPIDAPDVTIDEEDDL